MYNDNAAPLLLSDMKTHEYFNYVSGTYNMQSDYRPGTLKVIMSESSSAYS